MKLPKEGEPAVYTAIPGNFSVDFEGDSAELIADSQNFTDDLELFLPGDSQRKMMELKNTSGSTKSLYMKAACLSSGSMDGSDGIAADFTEGRCGNVVYQGSMTADTLGDAQRLCTLAPGETVVLQAIFSCRKNWEMSFPCGRERFSSPFLQKLIWTWEHQYLKDPKQETRYLGE